MTTGLLDFDTYDAKSSWPLILNKFRDRHSMTTEQTVHWLLLYVWTNEFVTKLSFPAFVSLAENSLKTEGDRPERILDDLLRQRGSEVTPTSRESLLRSYLLWAQERHDRIAKVQHRMCDYRESLRQAPAAGTGFAQNSGSSGYSNYSSGYNYSNSSGYGYGYNYSGASQTNYLRAPASSPNAFRSIAGVKFIEVSGTKEEIAKRIEVFDTAVEEKSRGKTGFADDPDPTPPVKSTFPSYSSYGTNMLATRIRNLPVAELWAQPIATAEEIKAFTEPTLVGRRVLVLESPTRPESPDNRYVQAVITTVWQPGGYGSSGQWVTKSATARRCSDGSSLYSITEKTIKPIVEQSLNVNTDSAETDEVVVNAIDDTNSFG